jgi:hypothetical protein
MSMSPDERDTRRWAQPLTGRLPEDADAVQIADTSVAVWQSIDRALNPVVGPKGLAALYHRSLTLTIPHHAWLGDARRGDALSAMDLAALQSTLAQQPAAEAAAASVDHFRAFRELLASLVGAALTERLLGTVWDHSSGTPPAQDTTP